MNCIQLYNVNFVINCYCNLLVGRQGRVDSATIVPSSPIFHPSLPYLRVHLRTDNWNPHRWYHLIQCEYSNTDKKSNYWPPRETTQRYNLILFSGLSRMFLLHIDTISKHELNPGRKWEKDSQTWTTKSTIMLTSPPFLHIYDTEEQWSLYQQHPRTCDIPVTDTLYQMASASSNPVVWCPQRLQS